MANIKTFVKYFTSDDVLDVELKMDGKQIVGFTLNYRAVINDRWVEVARYDTCHGALHAHRFWLPGKSQIHDLESPKKPRRSYNEILDVAEDDVVRNWRKYRRHMEGKK